MNSDLARVPSSPRAAIGFRAHSGWTALVALSVDGNDPRILARGRPELVETFTYEFRQPYHTAKRMPLEKARVFISKIEAEAQRLAQKAIRSVQTDLQKQGYDLTSFALISASAKPLPSLDKILASHALIHTADGELFRKTLAHASQNCRLAEFTVKESELIDAGCKTFGLKSKDLMTCLTVLGKTVGPPWSQDEKFAALAAWLALCSSNIASANS